MNDPWRHVLTVLDSTVGYQNKTWSSIKQAHQSYDEFADEHIILLEYRFKAVPIDDPSNVVSMPLLAEINARQGEYRLRKMTTEQPYTFGDLARSDNNDEQRRV